MYHNSLDFRSARTPLSLRINTQKIPLTGFLPHGPRPANRSDYVKTDLLQPLRWEKVGGNAGGDGGEAHYSDTTFYNSD